MKTAQDQTKFTEALCLTIQCLTGTMHPPAKMLVASYEALKDFELKQLLSTLTEWRRSSTTWPSPAAIRVAIEGRPDVDSFDDFMDNFVSRGRVGEYADPLGRLVLVELGGSGGFQTMNLRDRDDWKQRWVKAYRKIAHGERAEISAKSE